MTSLWLAFAILLLPALWLLVAPLRGARQLHDQQRSFEANDTQAEQNVAIFQRRLASLKAAYERGDIDGQRFQEDKLELERSLLEDTATRAPRSLKAAAAGKLIVPLIMIAVVAASTIWYQQRGAEGDLVLYAIQQEMLNAEEGVLPMYLERLESEAERQPHNPNVWSSLFSLYRETGQYEKAAGALEQLMAIDGRVPALLAQLAQLRFFMAERAITPEVQALVDETMAQDPRQPMVLGLLGIDAFDSGDYEVAIDRWRRALANVEDSNTAASMREGIRVAQERLRVEPEIAADEVAAHGVRVTVTLDDSLVGRMDDEATVFITARDVEGELPPLAVVRTQLSALPFSVVLDDATAMSPQAQISQVSEAHLMVRISRSGQTTPQPGDLFGVVENVRVGPVRKGDTTHVVIDQIYD